MVDSDFKRIMVELRLRVNTRVFDGSGVMRRHDLGVSEVDFALLTLWSLP